MGRHSLSVIVALAVFALLAPCSALAQYMYLDSNGDGIHTAADVVNAVGTTQVDIWLRTDHNRDGSVAVCPNVGDLTISSYTVALRASGGAVTWSGTTNLMPLFGIFLGNPSNTSEWWAGYAGAIALPPGGYHLARVTVAVASGTPSIDIVPLASTLPIFTPLTSFGSMCGGNDFDNTMKLGLDWQDVDGLAFSSGGSANVAPVIPEIADVTVATGDIAVRDLAVTDPDGDGITGQLVSTPSFVHWTELTSGSGALTGRILVHPSRSDAGDHQATLQASDGSNASTRTFSISVAPGPNHPPSVLAPKRMRLPPSTVARQILTASDADGDAMQFSLLFGPAYASVTTAQAGHGGAAGYLTLRPTLCDVGSTEAVVGVSDGYASSAVTIAIDVLAPQSAPAAPHTYPVAASAVAVGDFDEDGHADAVTVGESREPMVLFRGDGSGALSIGATLRSDFSSIAVAVGDWNHDGHADIAASNLTGDGLFVFDGRGDGTFADPITIPGIALTTCLVTGDWNHDAVDDLIATGQSSHATVLLGHAGSGLTSESTLPMPSLSNVAAVADYDLDGNLDVAITTFAPGVGCLVFFGRGDGTFGDRRGTTGAAELYSAVPGDWNLDGNPDLGVTQFAATGTYVSLGNGHGDFSFSFVAKAYISFTMATTDWNGDGAPDLLVTSDSNTGLLLLGQGNGAFTTAALGFPIGYGLAIADLDEDGRPDLLAANNGTLDVLLNPTTAPTGVVARAFTSNAKMITVVPSSRLLEVRLEPEDGTFAAQDIDPGSIRLLSEGTGSVSSIAAFLDKGMTIGDTDHNGVPELSASFLMTDVAHLFDGVHGKITVSARMEAALLDARRLCAPVSLTLNVVGSGSLAARVEPNPLNPQGTLKFTVSKAGAVSVRLFDVKGRLVKTLWERRQTDPGDQELVIDGRLPSGQPMSTGIYFYRIETDGTSTNGRFAVLK